MRYLAAVIAVLLVAVAWAIDPPKPTAPVTPPPATEAPAKAPPAPVGERPDIAGAEAGARAPAEAEEELPPLPADVAPAGPPPARFNPTEKVRADFPVSFPIDI